MLEVGAAKAWAARFWLERDCEFVATDILVDEKIGLGRGAFYGDFGRVQADGENLPFADGTFDVTYCVATLHHALDLNKMVREMVRVTKPGGMVAGLNEGIRGVGRSADNPEQAGEKELGINEHVHTVWTYLSAFTRAGAVVRRMERSDGWPPVPFGYFLSRVPKVGMTLGTLAHLSVSALRGRLDLRAQAWMRATFVYPNSRRELLAGIARGEEPDSAAPRRALSRKHGIDVSFHDPLLTRRELPGCARRAWPGIFVS